MRLFRFILRVRLEIKKNLLNNVITSYKEKRLLSIEKKLFSFFENINSSLCLEIFNCRINTRMTRCKLMTKKNEISSQRFESSFLVNKKRKNEE